MSDYKFIGLEKSTNKEKKFMAIFQNKKTGRNKTIHFGAAGYENYTEGHLDEERKKRYLERHKKNENWDNPLTAGYWSAKYTWQYKTYKEALKHILSDLKKKGYL
jgi:hypothetical protein